MTVYLDMDGVVANFFKAACLAHGWNPDDKDLQTWDFYKSRGITLEEFWKPIDNYEFWIGVEEYPWAGDLVRCLRALNYKIVFASIPSKSSAAFTAKVDWIRQRKWYDGEEIILMLHKEQLAAPNRILIDDNDSNCDKWFCSGGRSYIFPQPWNEVGHPPTKDYLEDLLKWIELPQFNIEETRITNPATGGQKGSNLCRMDLIPAKPLWKVGELYGRGCAKYSARNWELGYAWSLSFAAMMRHAWQFWGGEKTDSETKCDHLASVVFHAMALMEFCETHPELDDRGNIQ
jgi:hypothetical protein